ncbi:hypothetical protein EDB84DRAFT_1446889 [Lactarius hengduanensis]|nr:hypothetical protein EDB84DRAFT_1446889 [Lactarius hengduanensis]
MPGSVVDVHGCRNSEDNIYFENVLRIAGLALRTIRPRVPTISTPLTIATVAVSPPTLGIKIKRSAPITDVVTASNISKVHMGTDPTSFSGIRRGPFKPRSSRTRSLATTGSPYQSRSARTISFPSPPSSRKSPNQPSTKRRALIGPGYCTVKSHPATRITDVNLCLRRSLVL